MKKFFSDAVTEAKKLPKGLWIAALVVPGGFATIGLYVAGKSAIASMTKKSSLDLQQK